MPAARSRREEYSEATRDALVDSAVALFTERGYAGTSLDEIAARSRVTKGALYHHFTGKQALFQAAFDAVETGVKERVLASVSAGGSPWEMAMNGLHGFLRICLEPRYQRIVMREGPTVMGPEEWRACEECHSLGMIRSVLEALISHGDIEPLPLDALTSILFGALGTGAELITAAAEPERVREEVGRVVERLLEGLRPPRD